MTSYRVTLIEREDGVSMRCPSLKGRHSQGWTHKEALPNTREVKLERLATGAVEAKFFKINEAEVV